MRVKEARSKYGKTKNFSVEQGKCQALSVLQMIGRKNVTIGSFSFGEDGRQQDDMKMSLR